MARYNITVAPDSHVSISSGNIKVGATPQFNTLPTNEKLSLKSGEILTDVVGTCSDLCECCKHNCYAVRSATCHHNSVIPAWAKNTLILREYPQRVKEDIAAYVLKNKCKYFRFHTSGEWESIQQMLLYKDICECCPDTNFYIYTKAFALLVEYVSAGYTFPDNLVINLSEWHGNIDAFMAENNVSENVADFFKSCNIFSYDDKAPECMASKTKMVHCPAVNEKGKETGVTCDNCRRCMTRGHKTAVYEH